MAYFDNHDNAVPSSKYKQKNQIKDSKLSNIIRNSIRSNEIQPLEDSENEIYLHKAGVALKGEELPENVKKLRES